MSHDSNGNQIKVGDRVTVEFDVKAVAGENNSVILVARNPKDQHETVNPVLTCSSKLTTLVPFLEYDAD